MSQRFHSNRGFTLIELAVVFAAVGLMIIMATDFFRIKLESAKLAETSKRIAIVQSAIKAYVQETGNLPCPASRNMPMSNTDFGRSILSPGQTHCDTDDVISGVLLANGRDPADADPAKPISSRIRIGTVPTRTLNIPDEYMADAWNNRFMYAVSANQTRFGYNEANGTITVQDTAGNVITSESGITLYVVSSYGPNAKGARTLDGNPASGGCTSAPGIDSQNCDNDNIFISGDITRKQGTTYFDDVVDPVTFIPDLASEKCGSDLMYYSPGHPAADENGCVPVLPVRRWDVVDMECDTAYPPDAWSPTTMLAALACATTSGSIKKPVTGAIATGQLPAGHRGSFDTADIHTNDINDQTKGLSVFHIGPRPALATGRLVIRAFVPDRCALPPPEPILLSIFVKTGSGPYTRVSSSILDDAEGMGGSAGNLGVIMGAAAITKDVPYEIDIRVSSYGNTVNGAPSQVWCWAGDVYLDDHIVDGSVEIIEHDVF